MRISELNVIKEKKIWKDDQKFEINENQKNISKILALIDVRKLYF